MENINTEDFISEIETQPAIWNTAHEDYSSKIAKKIAWEHIVRKFTTNFDELEIAEKNNTVLRFQRKWKSLRDCFTRELLKKKKERSGSNNASRKQYIYFQKLNFLQTVPKLATANMVEEENSQEYEEVEVKEEVVQEPEEIDVPDVDVAQKKRNTKARKKEILEDEELFAMLKEKVLNYGNEDDEDKLFMLSLVPELKKIPESAKLDVKVELLNVFKRARLQQFDPLNNTADFIISHDLKEV